MTSPLYCDPLHAEDYTYCILSKALTKPAPKSLKATSTSPKTQSDLTPDLEQTVAASL